jgi:hypothetical protein
MSTKILETLFNVVRHKSNNPLITGYESFINSKSLFSANCVVHSADQDSKDAKIIIVNGTVMLIFKDTDYLIYNPFHLENI